MRPRTGSEPQERGCKDAGAQRQIVPAEKGRERKRKERDNVREEKEEKGGKKKSSSGGISLETLPG